MPEIYIIINKNIYVKNGWQGFYRGFGLNMVEKFIEYFAYGMTYDGIKQYSSK